MIEQNNSELLNAFSEVPSDEQEKKLDETLLQDASTGESLADRWIKWSSIIDR